MFIFHVIAKYTAIFAKAYIFGILRQAKIIANFELIIALKEGLH